MIDCLKIVFCFAAGVIAGLLTGGFAFLKEIDYMTILVCLLVFVIGVGIGGHREALAKIKTLKLSIFLVPLAVVAGSFIGGITSSFILNSLSFREGVAVAFGFGYYSLSSVIITGIKGEELGVIALLSNIFRETITLLFAPLLVLVAGKLAPIASGGATSMDTTLPMVRRYSGEEYTLVSFFNGLVLSLLVPLLVPLALG